MLLRLAGRLAQYTSRHTVLVLTAIVGGVLVAGLTAASAGVLDAVAGKDGVASLDQPVLNQAIDLRNPRDERILTWLPT